MKKVLLITIIAVIAIIGVGGFGIISSYNGMVTLDEKVNSQWAQVENQLKRRADLIPNLINTVKGYASQEEEVLTAVTNARAGITEANTPEEYAKADAQMNQALTNLNIVVESYPDLKSNENFLSLQAELEGTENRIAVARRDYNESVKGLNNKLRRFPSNIIGNMFGFEQREYFQIDEGDTAVPEVNFN